MLEIAHVFRFDIRIERAIGDAGLDARDHPLCGSEQDTDDRRDLVGDRIASGELPADESRRGVARLVVVPRFEAKRPAIERGHAHAEIGLVAHRVVESRHGGGRLRLSVDSAFGGVCRSGRGERHQSRDGVQSETAHPPSAFTAAINVAPNSIATRPVRRG